VHCGLKNIMFCRLALFLLLSVLSWSCNQKNASDEISTSFEADLRDFMLEFLEETHVPGIGFAFNSDTVGTVMQVVGKADIDNFTADDKTFKYGLGLEVIMNKYSTTLLGHAGGNPGFIHEFYFQQKPEKSSYFSLMSGQVKEVLSSGRHRIHYFKNIGKTLNHETFL
jgi:hypothetical protein